MEEWFDTPMKSSSDLLGVLFDALSEGLHALDAVKLQYPLQGFESIEELRRAVCAAHARGYIHHPQEAVGGTFYLDLTEEGRERLPPTARLR
jgi:hypothetical protein